MTIQKRHIVPIFLLGGLSWMLAGYLLLSGPRTPGSTPIAGSTKEKATLEKLPDVPAQEIQPLEAQPALPARFKSSQKSSVNSRGDEKSGDRVIARNGKVYPLRTYKPALVPNDPSANQWWVAPNGMQQVWDIPYGSRQTKIAIIDTGFALNHQEFAGRWATNTAESGTTTNLDPLKSTCAGQIEKSCNGLDDDNNGYIDDWRGWDFVADDNSVQAGETNPDGPGTTHGTMVAGVAAATGNNGVGIAGVNWFSTILPLQALDDDDYGDSFTVASAIYYAADQGADVISISLGTDQEDPYMREAVQYALDKGAIVVAAAGNDGCDCIIYPANYPEVLAVSASNSSGLAASFSSYGANLDLIAPGQSLTSAYWTKANGSSAYATGSGTSFATPFVAGLLGLARSYQPNANWLEITGAMMEKADRKTLTAAAPRSNTLGFGFTRANTMLDRLRTPATVQHRYSFSALASDSARTYSCEAEIPASPLFELSRNGTYRYTVNPLERQRAAATGWTTSQLGYSCISLPTDTTHVLRRINLPSEIRNTFVKQ